MGLAERRAAKEFETTHYPALKKKLDEAAGFELVLDVKWETLAVDGMQHLYAECWPKVYFEPLEKALRAIARDDMGKEALKGSLVKVVVQNVGDVSYYDAWARFDDGVLTVDHKPTTNVDDIDPRARAVQNTVEAKL